MPKYFPLDIALSPTEKISDYADQHQGLFWGIGIVIVIVIVLLVILVKIRNKKTADKWRAK